MKQTSKKRLGFRSTALHIKKEPPPLHYLRQRSSFWIAAFSVVAYITGNMVGQYGWHVFWQSVLGKEDHTQIVYTGTVTPIDKVPDYSRWSQYGGDWKTHTFRQVPPDFLIPLPAYDSSQQRLKNHSNGEWDIYSVAYLGSYASGAEGSGSHPGIDIRVPVGTPVRAIANGIVDEVKEDPGFGKTVVIRHPNVPDAKRPRRTTTFYSAYAHLSNISVSEGAIVQKGEKIGASGQSGFVTGPHLHLQIDRDTAPWHPYWPFTSGEARREGMSTSQAVNAGLFRSRALMYTVNPLLYVQANHPAVNTLIASADEDGAIVISTARVEDKKESRIGRARRLRSERLAARLARRRFSERIVAHAPKPETTTPSDSSVVSRETVVTATDETFTTPTVVIAKSSSNTVNSVDIQHDGAFSGRKWEKLHVTLLDKEGHTVTNATLDRDITLRTAYGNAEFRPSTLSVLDFKDGVAEVQMLPRGRRTIVIQAYPYKALSRPVRFGG